MSSGDSDETGSEDESIKFDTIQRAGRRRTMVEKEEAKVEKKVEEKVGDKKEKEKVVEKQEEKEEENKQDGVVEKLLDEMVSKSMEDESSVKESSKEDKKENAGVVERVVEQLVSDTVDGSSPAQCLDTKEEVKTSLVPKVEEKLSNSDSTKLNIEKSETAANHIDGHDSATRDGSDTAKEIEVEKTGETSKGSVEPTRSNEKSEDLVAKENALTNHVEGDSESKVNDPTEDPPCEKSDAVASKMPSSNHNRSNSRGKKGKGDKNSPKKKKPNS